MWFSCLDVLLVYLIPSAHVSWLIHFSSVIILSLRITNKTHFFNYLANICNVPYSSICILGSVKKEKQPLFSRDKEDVKIIYRHHYLLKCNPKKILWLFLVNLAIVFCHALKFIHLFFCIWMHVTFHIISEHTDWNILIW